jgi:ATP-binding cassette, subfamily B, bacterial MsbA
MKELQAIKILSPIIKLYPWIIPIIIFLGIISYLAEGLGISLLIPFLRTLQPTDNQAIANNPFINAIDGVFSGIPESNRALVITLCILLAIFIKASISYIYTSLCYWLQYNASHRLRQQIFQQLMRGGQSFWDANRCGELISTLGQETERACIALQNFVWLIIDLCMIVVFISLLLLISWKFTIFVAGALLLISLIIRRITSRVQRLGKERVKASKEYQSVMVEGLTGIKTIQGFGRETYEEKKFERKSKKVRDISIKIWMLSAIAEPLSEGLGVAIFLCLMLIALQNQIPLPILLTFVFMLYRLQPQVKKFDGHRIQLISYSSSVSDVFGLMQRSRSSYISSGKITFSELRKGIDFKSASFYYNSHKQPAIDNINVLIPQGKTTALVGFSGAGKSTLINLIFRFYDVTSGEIYIDEYPLRELDLPSWRNHIAMVSQDVYIFNTTVRDNIAYGRPEATEEEIIAAAKQANAHEFISTLSEGYDTQVGDRGTRLSGGQKQRLSIARAILCDPEVLILDEATNALDSMSENLIQEAINKLSKNRTVIVIAHRLSTIEQADRILVMDAGKVVEQGTFQELIAIDGLFAKLYNLQYGVVRLENSIE